MSDSPTPLHRQWPVRSTTAEAMKRFGGSFYKSLGEALLAADPSNADKLFQAFPSILSVYGPGTNFYTRIVAERAEMRTHENLRCFIEAQAVAARNGGAE